jgi:hypothetical protein
MSKYYKPNNSRILYLNSSFNCVKNSSITLTRTSGGTGYTSAPTVSVVSASGDAGFGCTATATYATGAVSAITVINNGRGYNKLPTIVLTGGGNPGKITGLNITNGGSLYVSAPTITATGGGGTGFSAIAKIGTQSIKTTATISSGGTGYITGDTLSFTGGGGSGATGTITATSGVITGITISNGGSGYTSLPTVSINSTNEKNGVIVISLSGASVNGFTIINGGSNYATTPTIVFTPTNGGSGAVATPVLTLGTSAVITPTFLRTYSYSWQIPDMNIEDLAKLSTVNIIATGHTQTTPYTFRIMNLQYDSRNSYFSDFGNPILSLAQGTNICNYGSLSGENFSIILPPQTIRQIEISVDDSIITQNSGVLVAVNFVIAIEIEEYDPNYTQVGDPYGEASSRIKPMF